MTGQESGLRVVRPRSSESYVALAKRHAERVSDFAWFVLFLVLASAVGHYVWPWVWACFELWFGEGQSASCRKASCRRARRRWLIR